MSVRTSVFASDLMMREKGGSRRSIAGWLHAIAYGLWLGGLIAIGAFVAPSVALLIKTHAFATDHYAQQAILLGVIGHSFKIFNYACYVFGGVMLFSDLLQAYNAESAYGIFTWTRAFFTLVLLASSFYLGYYMFPHMDEARRLGNMTEFESLHKHYVLISQLQLIPLLIIPALTARRDQAVDSRY